MQFGFGVPKCCSALKNGGVGGGARDLINTVQGLLLSVNGLDLGYWVQS